MFWLSKIALLGCLTYTTAASNTRVQLSYGTFEGTTLSNGVTTWLGIPYAAKPLGDLRFAPPQDPPKIQGIVQAKQQGKICISTGVNANNIPPNQSEDCLYLSVYAPSNAKPTSKLPVFIYIQGGGFNFNANPNLNGSGLIQASNNGIVVVTFNYRVGPFGFLASSATKDGKPITNNGLRDQRKVFEWVKAYISNFGGDPNHVTIGGASAGAASVSLHLTAYGGRQDNLFHAAAAESVSFSTVHTASEAQYQYDHFASLAGCSNTNPAKSLACLRGKQTRELVFSNVNIPEKGQSKAPLYMFAPTIDNDIVTDFTYTLFAKGKFIKVPTIIGADTNDGRSFAPRSTSQSQSDAFLTQQFPSLTSNQLSSINGLYTSPKGCKKDCEFQRLADIYGQMRYMCPGLYISSAYANLTRTGKRGENELEATRIGASSLLPRAVIESRDATSPPAYAYRYNVEDPKQVADGLGVPHTAEVAAIWGPTNIQGNAPASYANGQPNAKAVSVVQAYWTSFIKHFDPNIERAKGSAEWQSYYSKTGQPQRMLFNTGGVTGMEQIDQNQRQKCAYLQSIGPAIKQ